MVIEGTFKLSVEKNEVGDLLTLHLECPKETSDEKSEFWNKSYCNTMVFEHGAGWGDWHGSQLLRGMFKDEFEKYQASHRDVSNA